MILITRPKKQANSITKKLIKLGHKVLVDSLLEIHTQQNSNIIIPKPQAFVITSANAINFIAKIDLNHQVKFFTIGQRTASEVQKIGFKNIKIADNSVISLRNSLLAETKKENGAIIYFAGDIITYDLEKFFQKQNFNFKTILAYKTTPIQDFKKETIEAIKIRKIKTVLIYSNRTAEIFWYLLKKNNLLEIAQKLQIQCLSQKIAKFFLDRRFQKVSILSFE
ncbi:uroporphyrinogen-III synthase [Flavobacteriaceae bacterium]|nr:uroporphyrinogen-III synthase [Flavobacteriaceae bacterium]